MHLIQDGRAKNHRRLRSRGEKVSKVESKFLNQRTDSRMSRASSQLARLAKKNSQILQANAAKPNFPNTSFRYGDK
jgi:hypothetical protein